MAQTSFTTRLKRHLAAWAPTHGITQDRLEREGSLVLTHEHRALNLYDDGWWRHIEGKAHRWAGALNSSQCFAVNLFGPLTDDPDLARSVTRSLLGEGAVPEGAVVECRLEETPDGAPGWLGEGGQPTQVDVFLNVTFPDGRQAACLVEVKLAEVEFGGCRGGIDSTRGGKNPDSARCLDLASVRSSPSTHCWLAEAEGRHYWDWIDDESGSFSQVAFARETACPFRHGLYQLMRNRVLADALVVRADYEWARVAVCVHPDNDRARRLPESVCGEPDVVDGFRQLVGTRGLDVMSPDAVVDAVEIAAPDWSDWGLWLREKYLLS